MEELYETVCGIVMSKHNRLVRAHQLSEFYNGLGSLSVALDNIMYERLGMSCEDVTDMLRQGSL